ncbi:MAG: ABC transporter permease [Bacteroidia bacterium]|nr:ABC transporter permease [Bacteroidia bacterium]MDW8235892.1 ABC transporter permease [Bacteroidia bacterium]
MIAEALRALWEYRLRAILTLSILAFGITALVGVLTALEALRGYLNEAFGGLSPHAFMITGGEVGIRIGRRGRMFSMGAPLQKWEANRFYAIYAFPGADVARSQFVSASAKAVYQGKDTPARVRLLSVDASYVKAARLKLAHGRFFTQAEEERRLPVVVLGGEVARLLFPTTSPINKWVQIGGRYYKVIGALERRGGLAGINLDWECFVPWGTGRSELPIVQIYVAAPSVEAVPAALQKARSVMRVVRRLSPRQTDNFSFLQPEQLTEFVLEQLRIVRWATIGITLLTLLGATLSLTNILLVIVKERTHEIGLRMALGASRRAIRKQFLTEAVVIAVVGGLGGIGLGVLMGNIVALLLGMEFILPWRWVALAVGLSGTVGIIAGYQPANEAAKLNPVEALRYE